MLFQILDVLAFRGRSPLGKLLTLVLVMVLAGAAARAGDDIQQTDEDTRAMLKRAEKLTRRGEFPEAEKLLRRVIERVPNHSPARLRLAQVLLKQKNLRDAYEISLDIAKAEPKNALAFAVLGTTLLHAGSFREAETLLVNGLSLDRKEAVAWAGLGLLDFYENRMNDAIANLREAAFLEPDEPDYVFALGQVSARAERYNEAAEAYRRFLIVAPAADKERRDRIKGLISFLTFLGRKSRLYEVNGTDRAAVRFELVRDRPVVEVRINDKDEPLRFVLDTGSGITVISHETAQRLKIKPVARGGLARAIGGDGKFEIVYGFLRSVSIGDVRVGSVPVYIRHFHSNTERIDGYIGLSMISKFLTTIDYGEMSFSLVKKDVADKLGIVENKDLFLPLRLTSSGFLSGEVQLEGIDQRLNFIVDTGASVSVIADEIAATDEIRQFVRDEKLRVIGAAGVTESVPSFLLPRVTFGNHSRERIMAISLDLDLINEASGFRQSGILGGNFLKNYRLTFDFKNSKVIFHPVGK